MSIYVMPEPPDTLPEPPAGALIARISITKVMTYEYSALIDEETCQACAEADGKRSHNKADLPPAPHPNCTNPNGCRCMHIAEDK